MRAARKASPAVQIAAPNIIKSFAKNCPGIGDGNGKPYPGCHTPGVVKTKVSVMRNVMIAPMLPMAETNGANGRVAISRPRIISVTPINIAAPRTLITLYIQDISGELVTNP